MILYNSGPPLLQCALWLYCNIYVRRKSSTFLKFHLERNSSISSSVSPAFTKHCLSKNLCSDKRIFSSQFSAWCTGATPTILSVCLFVCLPPVCLLPAPRQQYSRQQGELLFPPETEPSRSSGRQRCPGLEPGPRIFWKKY